MVAKSTPVANTSAADLDRVMAMIKEARGVKTNTSISTWLADKVADSARGVARIGAGAAAGVENASFSFAAERERQTRRTAQAILAAAKS